MTWRSSSEKSYYYLINNSFFFSLINLDVCPAVISLLSSTSWSLLRMSWLLWLSSWLSDYYYLCVSCYYQYHWYYHFSLIFLYFLENKGNVIFSWVSFLFVILSQVNYKFCFVFCLISFTLFYCWCFRNLRHFDTPNYLTLLIWQSLKIIKQIIFKI